MLATALILGFGIGTFSGLVGIREWRERSADESFAAMRADDLRVDLASGGYVPAGRLAPRSRPCAASTVAAAEERLLADGQLDASRPGRPLLVPARIVGLPLRPGGQSVDRLAVHAGRDLTAADAGRRVAMLDSSFADHFDLRDRGRIRIAGPGAVPYVGHGVTPSYVLVLDEAGFPGAEASLGVVYLPLAAAQRAAGLPGAVNELVLRVGDGVGLRPRRTPAEAAFASRSRARGVTIVRGDEEDSRVILYRDARNDQKLFLILAILVLAGAVFAAFNLMSRVVEAQRREIGIGMALGAPPWLLALRPLLLGLQIALLGILLGLPVGALASGRFAARSTKTSIRCRSTPTSFRWTSSSSPPPSGCSCRCCRRHRRGAGGRGGADRGDPRRLPDLQRRRDPLPARAAPARPQPLQLPPETSPAASAAPC